MRLLEETRRLAEALGLPEDLDPDSEEVFDAADAETAAAEGWQATASSPTCVSNSSTLRSSRSRPAQPSPSAEKDVVTRGFERAPAAGGTYKIANYNSGLLLGVTNMSTAGGAQALQRGDNGTSDHLWRLTAR